MTHATECYHCGSALFESTDPILAQADTQVAVCCQGCKAITEHIFQSGLSQYYEFRSDMASKPNEDVNFAQYQMYQDESVVELVATKVGEHYQLVVSVENIHCAACAWLIEHSIQTLDGIESISVNTVTERANIKWSPNLISLVAILSRLHEIGYPSKPFQVCDTENQIKQQEKQYIKRLGVAGLFTMQVMMLAVAMYYGAFANMESHQTAYFKWISMGLSLPVVFYSALPFLTGAIASVRARRLNMDVPVALAIYGAFFVSLVQLIQHGFEGDRGEVFFESISMFTFLLLIGKYMEFKGKSRAILSNANLNTHLPLTVGKIADGEIVRTLVKDIAVGDKVVIKPGERLAIDGIIEEGFTTVNESVLNGEFEPQSRQIGDKLLAGSVNNDGTVKMAVTATGASTTLSQISALQTEFAAHKPKFGQLADNIAHWFVFSQLILALITYIYWYFNAPDDALWIALSVLVATCPCALSLATPTAYTCIMSALNRHGILVKDPTAFDTLPQVSHIAFDKTGTLTKGEFSIQQSWYDSNCDSELLNALVQIQQHSEHPIAKAFHRTALGVQGHALESRTVSHVVVDIGQGLRGQYRGQELRIGTAQYCEVENQDKFNVYMTYNGQHWASFHVADELKSEAQQVVGSLTSKSLAVTILSGDSSTQVEKTAQQLNINAFQKACRPQDKANIIAAQQAQGDKVMMIGDGINDAPVFAIADVSVAMASGADISKHSADVIILNNNLVSVELLLSAAIQTRQTIQRNLNWSLLYNLVILPIAMMGYVAPYIAVIGMSASSILVVTNSLKLLRINK